jgi:hypothetical protein
VVLNDPAVKIGDFITVTVTDGHANSLFGEIAGASREAA